MKNQNLEILRIQVQEVAVQPQQEGYHAVELLTERDRLLCRYYPVENAQKAAIFVGGVGGDWDSPANGLYPTLCQELQQQGIASLRIHFRYSTQLEEAVYDVLTGIVYLQDKGINSVALTGHSFGGAVVIRAAAISEAVQTVVALAPQAYGADVADQLANRCSLLLIHGEADSILSPNCSHHIHNLAREPKKILLYPNAGHGLDEVAAEVHGVVRDWIPQQLER